ncbi:ammonia-dependent NAD(+) synthetase [Lactobacillus sp. IBH004]|uniref:NH(3)-dependent NAD(+) synthetase n=1 Tax=Lactobacillus melliventris TaxID=1218507 RepID=A0A0F4LFT9_9LACO|nr:MULTISPECIES: ammonia-dependent NAD(+) synthetase [Lactobacillus]KJY57455.1 NH(3)-dependent NAD(+) synthetase [Lactobacillus melliventris]MBC6350115.1 ammonia-dependent NAD(+) synthetase [Lactobacillus melliventris]NUE98374.1 ammonia-dependent NAD(+) synthetase [Lactobacillus melliventris]PXY84046.1 ammonia-dependent NAD(+) synthetase [Lactobacillus melliventris]RMC61966.1 ammonia-dependent NAD(+) synthetase [Lactobacillus sp. ESL0259]
MRPLQKEIIKYEHVLPQIDPQKEIRRSVDFLKDYLKANTFLKSYVLGISGGQDSTLAGKLCQMAISEMRSETGDNSYQFIAVRLPYGVQADAQDAADAVAFQRPDQDLVVNIKPAVDALVSTLNEAGQEITDFNKGNIKARERMVVQYAIAGAHNGAVVGTDHAAENFSGFYTKYGDGAADLTPLFRLDKRQGKQMLKFLNCPEHLYHKAPTADLEENKPGLPDEVALGVSYRDVDDYLEGHEVSEEAAEKIESLWRKSEHKRHLPVTVFDDFYRK